LGLESQAKTSANSHHGQFSTPAGSGGSSGSTEDVSHFLQAPDWLKAIGVDVDANLARLNLPPISKPKFTNILNGSLTTTHGTQASDAKHRTITDGWAGYKRPTGVHEDPPRYGPVIEPPQKRHWVSPIKLTAADLNSMSGNTNRTAGYTTSWQRPGTRSSITMAMDSLDPVTVGAPSVGGGVTRKVSLSTGNRPIDPAALGALPVGGSAAYKPASISSPNPLPVGSPPSPNPSTATPIPAGYNSTLTLSGEGTVTVAFAPSFDTGVPVVLPKIRTSG
jgi:hypothetical protein